MGLGFTLALTCIGLVREILGSGAIFGNVVIPEDYHIAIFVLAPGAFFVLAVLTALQNKFKAPSATNGSVPQSRLACGGNCMECTVPPACPTMKCWRPGSARRKRRPLLQRRKP